MVYRMQTSQLQEEGEKCTDIREEYTEEQVQYISTIVHANFNFSFYFFFDFF